jgi:siroheme synthase (precorrin-2 oxidase/ferrochelatase)
MVRATTVEATPSRHALLWFAMVCDPSLDADHQLSRRAKSAAVPAIAGTDMGLCDVAIPETRRDRPRVAVRQGGGVLAHAASIRRRPGGLDFRR